MNWEAIGAIGEITGALGVIASLVYLAAQIRHGSRQTELNTRSVQASAYQQLIDHHTSLNMQLATSSDLFDTLRKAEERGIDGLEMMEFSVWETFIAGYVRSFLNGYYLHQQGFISAEQWANFSHGLEALAQRGSFQAWWATEKDVRRFPPGFVAIVDGFIE